MDDDKIPVLPGQLDLGLQPAKAEDAPATAFTEMMESFDQWFAGTFGFKPTAAHWATFEALSELPKKKVGAAVDKWAATQKQIGGGS